MHLQEKPFKNATLRLCLTHIDEASKKSYIENRRNQRSKHILNVVEIFDPINSSLQLPFYTIYDVLYTHISAYLRYALSAIASHSHRNKSQLDRTTIIISQVCSYQFWHNGKHVLIYINRANPLISYFFAIATKIN